MDGLDQPSTAGAAAALPGCGRTIRQHAPRRRGRAATSLGVPVRWQDEAADLLSSVRRTPQGTVCAPHTCLLCCGRCFLEKRYALTRDNMVLNALSRWRPS